MYQVHVGTRPGRPGLLLALSISVLALALLGAWWQVERSRALGPEVRLPGTPLVVRPPRNWTAAPKTSDGLDFPFVLKTEVQVRGARHWEADRVVRFRYEPNVGFRHPADWFARRQIVSDELKPTQIGPFPALQAREGVNRKWALAVIQRELLVRVACLPGGGMIIVRYEPMTDLTVADLQLFDKICRAVRVDDPNIGVDAAAIQTRSGLRLSLPSGSVAALAPLEDVPGCYIEGHEDGAPAWSIGVFRTWLAEGRTPVDLLHDYAFTAWLVFPEDAAVEEYSRADGAQIALVRDPAPRRNLDRVVAALVVAESPEDAAMLYLFTNDTYTQSGIKTLRALAEALDFEPTPAIPDLAAAATAGRELAELLTRKGALPWWGSKAVDLKYQGAVNGIAVAARATRRAKPNKPSESYEGYWVQRVVVQPFETSLGWTLDQNAVGYTIEYNSFVADGVPLRVVDVRTPSSAVRRSLFLSDRVRWSGTVAPGPSFVAPPAESLADSYAARAGNGAWLIEVMTQNGLGAQSRLLKALPPEEDRPRVLLLNDYQPTGMVCTYDQFAMEGNRIVADGELYKIEQPGSHITRVH